MDRSLEVSSTFTHLGKQVFRMRRKAKNNHSFRMIAEIVYLTVARKRPSIQDFRHRNSTLFRIFATMDGLNHIAHTFCSQVYQPVKQSLLRGNNIAHYIPVIVISVHQDNLIFCYCLSYIPRFTAHQSSQKNNFVCFIRNFNQCCLHLFPSLILSKKSILHIFEY
jgi:hypothetical protein